MTLFRPHHTEARRKPRLARRTRRPRCRRRLRVLLLLVTVTTAIFALSSYAHTFTLPRFNLTSDIWVESGDCYLRAAWLSVDIWVRRPCDWYVNGVMLRGLIPDTFGSPRTCHWTPPGMRSNSMSFSARWPDETHSLAQITIHHLQVNLWLPFALLGALACACEVRRHIRRARQKGCCDCGYNLTGNVSGVCPECGAAVPEKIKGPLQKRGEA